MHDLTVATVLAAAGLASPSARMPRTPRMPRMPRMPTSIRRAISFIDDNLDQPIALADIADASRMSSRGLQAAFRRHLDETPMQRL